MRTKTDHAQYGTPYQSTCTKHRPESDGTRFLRWGRGEGYENQIKANLDEPHSMFSIQCLDPNDINLKIMYYTDRIPAQKLYIYFPITIR